MLQSVRLDVHSGLEGVVKLKTHSGLEGVVCVPSEVIELFTCKLEPLNTGRLRKGSWYRGSPEKEINDKGVPFLKKKSWKRWWENGLIFQDYYHFFFSEVEIETEVAPKKK